MAVFGDRVLDSTSSTGTGSITLDASPPSGFITFAAAFGSACNFVSYTIVGSGNEWETGLGTLSGSTTLARTKVLSSGNSNSLVSFSAGTKTVFCAVPASWVNDLPTRGRLNMYRIGATWGS